MSTETVEKDSKNYPILRNLQYSPLKQGEEQYIVLVGPHRFVSGKAGVATQLFLSVSVF